MTNNQLCRIIGFIGCAITAWHGGLMMFGNFKAVWGMLLGLIMVLFSLYEYE